jgi:hypothetical protein
MRLATARVVRCRATPLAAACLLLGIACQPAPEGREDAPAPEGRQDAPAPVAEAGEAAASPVVREQRDDPAAGLVLIDSASLAGGAGAGHRVELRVAAEQWPDGRVLWEHAHRWVLLVRTGDGVFVLMDEQVPNGHASFLLVESEQGMVVVAETVSGTSGLRVSAFSWDPAADGYREISAIRVDGTLRHRTPLEYQQ